MIAVEDIVYLRSGYRARLVAVLTDAYVVDYNIGDSEVLEEEDHVPEYELVPVVYKSFHDLPIHDDIASAEKRLAEVHERCNNETKRLERLRKKFFDTKSDIDHIKKELGGEAMQEHLSWLTGGLYQHMVNRSWPLPESRFTTSGRNSVASQLIIEISDSKEGFKFKYKSPSDTYTSVKFFADKDDADAYRDTCFEGILKDERRALNVYDHYYEKRRAEMPAFFITACEKMKEDQKASKARYLREQLSQLENDDG